MRIYSSRTAFFDAPMNATFFVAVFGDRCRHKSFPESNARRETPKGGSRPLVLFQVGPAHGARNVRVLLDVLAGGENLPQLTEEGPVVAVVQLSELGLDGVGGLLCAVEGNTTDLRVRLVGMQHSRGMGGELTGKGGERRGRR